MLVMLFESNTLPLLVGVVDCYDIHLKVVHH